MSTTAQLKTLDGSNISVLLPTRFDDVSRYYNLMTVINYYRKYFDNIEIIVAIDHLPDQPANIPSTETTDDNESISFDQAIENLKIVADKVIEREGEKLFCKWWGYNTSALATERKYILCADTDIVVEPFSIATALDYIDDHKVIIPYNGVSLYCVPNVRLVFTKYGYNMEVLRHVIPETIKLQDRTDHVYVGHIQSPGGPVLFDRQTFIEFGGYNPRFKGWGYEDDEILKRFHRLGASPSRSSGQHEVLWHFHHANGQREKHPHYQANALLARASATNSLESLRETCPPLK